MLSLFFIPVHAETPEIPEITPEVEVEQYKTIDELIEYWGNYYGSDIETLKRVANCESGYKHNPERAKTILGDGGRAYGTFQFHRPTFEMFSERLGEPLEYDFWQDHIKLASWAFANNQAHHWTCK